MTTSDPLGTGRATYIQLRSRIRIPDRGEIMKAGTRLSIMPFFLVSLLLISVLTVITARAQSGEAAVNTTTSHDPSAFINVVDFIPTIILDLRYFGGHNFIGSRINGYNAEHTYLTFEAAVALKNVQEELMSMSLSLKIYDAYRPQRAVDHFVDWAENLADTAMKAEFYPEVKKKHLFRDGYIAARSGHSRGSTLDVTIVALSSGEEPGFFQNDLQDCRLPAAQRYRDTTIDMGTGYDCFDTLSWTMDGRIGVQQRANRLLLKTIMERHGFRNYEREWWHYTLIDEPFEETYFDFPIE